MLGAWRCGNSDTFRVIGRRGERVLQFEVGRAVLFYIVSELEELPVFEGGFVLTRASSVLVYELLNLTSEMLENAAGFGVVLEGGNGLEYGGLDG